MEKYYEVTYNDIKASFKEETSFKDIALYFQRYFDYPILTAKINDDFIDLSENLKKDCKIDFFTRASEYGNKVYSRSARFILALAVNKLIKKASLVIHHSQDQGVYFTVENAKLPDNFVSLLNQEFQKIVDSDYLFTKLTVSRLEAMEYFHKKKMFDKENLLKYVTNTYINLYRIDDIYDYYYGRMAYSTKQIDLFKIYKLKDGYVLQLPSVYNPDKILKISTNNKVYDKFNEFTNFGKSINLNNASDLNLQVSESRITDIILMSEAYYNNQIANITDDIVLKNKKIVLLAGPSSSGKTTTSKKIGIYLSSKGYNTKAISIDDYFISLKDRQKDIDGMVDFESVNAIDIELFNEQISKLLSGEEVYLSRYNFLTGKREFDKSVTKLSKNDIIIVEGLHALNDKLTTSISNKDKYKIYISPLTSLTIDNHNHVHTSDVRKLRRIIRDSKTRAVSAKNTLKMWGNIQKGEMNYIYPYQNGVDAVINSALMYEIGVLKTYAEPLLYSVTSDDLEYPEALRLINFLKNFLPIPSDDIPNDSVLREFIGGSCFKK